MVFSFSSFRSFSFCFALSRVFGLLDFCFGRVSSVQCVGLYYNPKYPPMVEARMMPNMAKHIMIIIFFCKYPQQNMYHPMGSECGRGRQREKQEKNERERKKKRQEKERRLVSYLVLFVFHFFCFLLLQFRF